ncbi:hypothetical protein BpHYR1_000598 [Brachionus plicatilis]|uniref:Uncharacterized protein n=1 Tax=Brachionus plicatilis TaxID=10195 RepID=A0A3M7R6C1_BRAPC|nr:hypothetical protein BpHYR1_000598 [Brachionus plicatilis]
MSTKQATIGTACFKAKKKSSVNVNSLINLTKNIEKSDYKKFDQDLIRVRRIEKQLKLRKSEIIDSAHLLNLKLNDDFEIKLDDSDIAEETLHQEETQEDGDENILSQEDIEKLNETEKSFLNDSKLKIN